MIKNYLKIAFRSLWRSKAHSFINVFGLTLGITCCVLIVLFVCDEWTFDTFHSKAKQIYRVYAREDWGENQQFFNTVTPFPMGPALKDNFPEVVSHVRINNIGTLVKVGANQFSEQVMIGGQGFFDMFDFKLLQGDRTTVMLSQSAVILTERLAKKYFGNTNPIDKVISMQLGESVEDFFVKAVAANIPTNSSIQFDILISDLNYPKLYSEGALTSAWFNINPETYVLLKEGTNAAALERKFPSVFKTILGEEEFTRSKYAPGLQPLTSVHLDTSYPIGIAPVSNPRYAYILAAIAALILFAACINFVTLSVGRSLNRAKEVGVRKVVGAARPQLILQFIGEALIITSISVIIAIGLGMVALPLFNDLSGKQLTFPLDGFMASVVFSLLIIIGLIAGSYPAFVLSGFRPINILKGAVPFGSSKQAIRKALVGVQVLLSIFLVSSTLVMRGQLQFLQRKDLGFNKEQLAVIQLNVPQGGRMTERVMKGFEKAQQFKTELTKFSGIAAVGISSHDFGHGNWASLGYEDDKGVYRTFYQNTVDEQYIPALKMKIVQGRNFSNEVSSDSRTAIIVNESFAKEMGWTEAIGKKIPRASFEEFEVIGVVKDFNYQSLYTKVSPVALSMNPMIIAKAQNINIDNDPLPKLIVRLRPEDMANTLDDMKKAWHRITGGEEFAFTFVDQALAAQYRNDQNLGKIVSIAALLAIVIGGLGLYSLASLAMKGRIKEISIRKVFGATEQSLLMLLSKDYVLMILTCLVLSTPLTAYLMQNWLSTFEYRIVIGWQVFVWTGGISLLIAFLAIGYQTICVARAQPANTLKYE
jgi:putative ABC transport system permease protein